jgi:hypothetical protein
LSKASDKIYDMFMADSDSCRSSYLYDHYQRGMQGIMKPAKSQKLALAAWRAGRDTVAAAARQVEPA